MEKQPPAEKDTPLSSQVLEYYRNYSQSHQLPRYLCGEVPNTAVVTNLVQGHYEIEDNNIPSASTIRRPPLIGQDHTLISGVPPVVIITDVNVDNRGQISPTSSITSNRKLEWDNGADIGYENCEVANRNLFRSSSLPTLNTLERNIQKDFLRHSPDGRISETTPKNVISNNSNSSTDSGTKIVANTISTSTTTGSGNLKPKTSTSGHSSSITVSSKSQKKVFTSSSSSSEPHNSDDKAQNIIYVPVLVHSPPLAESTPNASEKQLSQDTVYYETPMIVHPRKPPRKNAIFTTQNSPQKLKSTSFDDLQNLQLLNETVEQRNTYFQQYLAEKQQNLCITKAAAIEYTNKSVKDKASIAIQTEDGESSKRERISSDHFDKGDCSSTDDSSKIVDCNSFEYLYGSGNVHQIKSTGSNAQADAPVDPPPEHQNQINIQIGKQEIVQGFIANALKHSKAKSALINVTSTETVSSESHSAKISSKLSNNLISDVDKSVDLLMRLLHSKKYDQDAKKYYVRKIISKIVDSKYEDDKTTATTSSTGTDKTTSASSTCEPPEQHIEHNHITIADPPIILPASREIKSETNLQDIADIYPRLQRNPRFTLTNNEFLVGQSKGDDNDNTSSDLFRPHSRHVFPSYTTDSSAEKMQDTNRSSSSQSWKDDKTASERLMESLKPITEDSDELVGFARRERQSQLNWISNEINHLSKLKLLLEKKEVKPDPTQSTAIYMITTDKCGRSSNRPPCNCHNRLNIPNVISANQTPGHHHIKLQHCIHHQQEYKIRQLKCEHNQCNHRGNVCYCQYQLENARRNQKTGLSSTTAMPSSSEDQRETSNEAYKEQTVLKQNIEETNKRETVDTDKKKSDYAYVGVTCTLLESRAAIVASNQEQNLPETSKIVQGSSGRIRSSKPNVVFPKSTSVPISTTSSPKKRSSTSKGPLLSENSNRKMETYSATKGSSDYANKATLISSDVYRSNDFPTTSVRRYVFEIPIVDLHTNQEASSKVKSSDFGVNKKETNLGPVNNADFEVRNVHLTLKDKKKEDEKERNPVQTEPHKISESDELKQLTVSKSMDIAKSFSGNVLSHDKVSSFEYGPSISRDIMLSDNGNQLTSAESSLKSANEFEPAKSALATTSSIVKKNSSSIKPNERSKITQTVEVVLKHDGKVQEANRKVPEKIVSSVNKAMKRTTGSQTSSLENYMKKIVAEVMQSNSWNPRKVSSDQVKTIADSDKESFKEDINGEVKSDASSRRMSNETNTTTDSDKESFIQDVDDTIRPNRRRSDSSSSRKEKSQKVSTVHPERLHENGKRPSFKHYETTATDVKSDYISGSNRLNSIQNHLDDKKVDQNQPSESEVFASKVSNNFPSENIRDNTESSAVFIPKGFSKLEKIKRKLDDTPKNRQSTVERYSKESFSNKAAISDTRDSKRKDSKSKDLPDTKMNQKISKAPLQAGSITREIETNSEIDENNAKVIKTVQEKSEGKLNEIIKNIPTEKDDSQSNSSESKLISDKSSPTTTSITTSDDTMKICQCCRGNNISLGNNFTQAMHHPLCQSCYEVHQHSLWRNHQPFYMFPNHTCNCHVLLKTQQIQAMKTTINQLQNLESIQQTACMCPPHKKLPQQNNRCLTCNCPIQSRKTHHRDGTKTRSPSTKHNAKGGRHKHSGITYTLKLDTATEEDVTQEKIEEIQMGRYEEEIVVKVPNKRSKAFRKSSLDKGQIDKKEKQIDGEEKENDGGIRNIETKKDKKKTTKTLQEYLSTNRPTFIESAEQRRRCLIELAYMREERCQKYKQLLAMTNGVPVMLNGQNPQNNGLTIQKPRIFSTKEMKRLTSKNYKKLPEVQQRLLDNKDRQLKKANRLLSDIFNKKLRDKVLKGQPSLSTSVSVINLM